MKNKKRLYLVTKVEQAKKIAKDYLKTLELHKVVCLGLPEIDDRYHIWRVPLTDKNNDRVGEVIIDAKTSLLIGSKTTERKILEQRLLGRRESKPTKKKKKKEYILSSLRNTLALGDSERILREMPSESIDLVFTSPPYYNARPEYSDFVSYNDYLLKIRKVIKETFNVLRDGRFFVMNISPILIRRASRSESSKRIAVPFDIHRIFIEEGFEFIDDIIWVKPEGAGWATGRGRRFAADRNPLQYKAVPITEYVLVYRKKSDNLIDWHLRNHPSKKALKDSKILGEYDKTNVWYISPKYSKKHPAIFPLELAKKVIRYYSFKDDVILDPFAGIGTTAKAAIELGRRFVMIEINKKYMDHLKSEIKNILSDDQDVHFINS